VAAIHRALGEEVPLARAIRDATVSASDPWRMLGATWSVARTQGTAGAHTAGASSFDGGARSRATGNYGNHGGGLSPQCAW